MKQTAVEWLVEEINKINVSTEARIFINKLEKQAKQMEREQRFKDFKAGQDSMEEGGKGFEQYYNKTYKQQKP